MILAWYWRENENILNFGEHITPYILNYFGVTWKNYSQRTPEDKECILIIGSELHKAKLDELKNGGIEKFYIWGQGKGTGHIFNHRDYDIEFYLVRGEETKNKLQLPSSIPTGDPGFVMPIICPMTKSGSSGTLYAPHHSNRKHIKKKQNFLRFDSYLDVMIHRNNFLNALQTVINAEFILTNSLHISIICMAYRIPFCVSIIGSETLNYPQKWVDIFNWSKIPLKTCSNIKDGLSWWNTYVKNQSFPDAQNILDTFPKHIF